MTRHLTPVDDGYFSDGIPVPNDPDDIQEKVSDYEVGRELARLRIRAEAKRLFDAEKTQPEALPEFASLADLLDEPDRVVTYRIDGLLPKGGRVILAAQFKAGKTTMMGNLIRCLVDGDRFLDQHDVSQVTGNVTLIDTEMDRGKLRDWLKDQDIKHTDKVNLIDLRGRVSTFDPMDTTCLDAWAAQLRAANTEFLIVDCLRPIIDSLGLDENHDTGRILVALDELANRAGVHEMFIVHHMGHNGERSRGDSRLRDWPDVEWKLVRQDADDPASQRFFSAYGRDVEVAECALDYDPATRHLTVAGGSRRDTAAEALVPDLLRLLLDEPGLSGRGIEEALAQAGVQQKVGRDSVKRAIEAGYVRAQPGPKSARLHYVTPNGEKFTQAPKSAQNRVSAGDALAREDHKVSAGQDGCGHPDGTVSAGDALASKITSDQQVIKKPDAHKTAGRSSNASVRQSSSGFTQRSESECVSAYLERRTHTHDADDKRVTTKFDAWVLAQLTHKPQPVGTIAEQANADPFVVQAALDRLLAEGRAVTHKPGQGPRTWSLPERDLDQWPDLSKIRD